MIPKPRHEMPHYRPTVKRNPQVPFHPAWYTIKEGGTWLEFHGWQLRDYTLLDQRSPTTVAMLNKLVHSLMSKDKLVKWDCINGFRLPQVETLSSWEKDQLEEQDNRVPAPTAEDALRMWKPTEPKKLVSRPRHAGKITLPYICYQCEEPVAYLFDDSRCNDCTRLTPAEIRGEV